ncbi:urea amidolyase related protein [Segniliparus rotundus DSM 44985]|uniref:Urea amidolyase related protein n=1 Tax=Segniliparus rotundus (strain ATCC BAA-972 / CDC 1076 / CIP 108378 / DSM 44985 / JCM 13578) TaxID=640132 RepID=D6ZAM1_SEGRD|nr:5-oxoprolinase/urea amidolyase family protein [Segniliparus rotundus]ADG98757.1 urea amidolyase related protein [Segniliparus rotundus DSM 44985]
MTGTSATVVLPGTLTTVQDWPGRTGYWSVGVPPSGPMDDLSFRLGNRALGNPEGAAGLESVMAGPSLRFSRATHVCVTGAAAPVAVDGKEAPMWEPVLVPSGSVLSVGRVRDTGLRVYVLVSGGFDVPDYLGSKATFTLGKFGGHAGRALSAGDEIPLGEPTGRAFVYVPRELEPAITHRWELAAAIGPHGDGEFFTEADIATLYETDYEVHFNSDRTGVRLIGPKPQWARPDGGEAGLHPSNIHDNAYSVGALDFTGDTPILLGPDGPSLGGFVCPLTVVSAERWKLGQLRPGDTVRFVPVRVSQAAPLVSLEAERRGQWSFVSSAGGDKDGGVILRADGDPPVTYRRSGDDNILVEYGPMALELELRARAHALTERLLELRPNGLVDVTPGVRSVQAHVDPAVLPASRLLGLLREVEAELPKTEDLVVPSNRVELPLSWDDPATREATRRYSNGVRADAPWLPWNIEFIRRMNGLGSVEDVRRTVFEASYLVLGLGDVYLGAPVATPVDPRHRLVTTKYNPARTWTPENAVGIGGAYLCVYGMEGPGGYQFVGRTVQMWNHRHPHKVGAFHDGLPWLLRCFDRIHWYPVSTEELAELRAGLADGKGDGGVRVAEGSFSLAEHRAFLTENADSIAAFRSAQREAMDVERAAWAAADEFAPAQQTAPTQKKARRVR